MRPIRIANFSGFYGDRASALSDMFTGADADVLVGDYLAEVTMSVLAKLRERDATAGYATGFLAHLRPIVDEFASSERRIVVNAGGLNPGGLATAIRTLHPGLEVATVSGDDVMDRLSRVDGAEELDPQTANAYLGGWGIARALESGARIVVCGRVADASLAVGAAAWWHEWRRNDWDALAGALIAGHLIECGPQVTGGNYSGFTGLALDRPSFPIAEVDEDGSARITKLPDADGAVTIGTVTAQLLYEIQGRWYANPDVVADLTSVQLEQLAEDVVGVSGTVGQPPPPTTKVAMTGVGEWENSVWLGVTGRHFEQKRRLLERSLRAALGDGLAHLHVELIGREADDPTSQNEATGFLRVVARGSDEKAVGRKFSGAVVELALANYPGLYATAPPGRAKRCGVYRSGLIKQADVHHVVTTADGTEIIVDQPNEFREFQPGFDTDDVDAGTEQVAELVEVPLGSVVDARSGDKGGNANVGFWVGDDARWKWLRTWLTVERLRALLPEAAELPVKRVELPNLRAINVVIEGILGEGAIASLRLDAQAKGLSEFLLARRVTVPREILRS
jgi:hypothetical protein